MSIYAAAQARWVKMLNFQVFQIWLVATLTIEIFRFLDVGHYFVQETR